MIPCLRKEKQKYHHHQKQRRRPKQTNTWRETTSWRLQWFLLWERWYVSLSLSKRQAEEIGFLLKRWFSNLEMGSESLQQSQTHPKTGREKGDLSFQFPVSTYVGLCLLSRREPGGGRQPVTARERLRTFGNISGIPLSASPNTVGSHRDLDPVSGGRTACWSVISTVACKSPLAIKRVWPRKHPDNPPAAGPAKVQASSAPAGSVTHLRTGCAGTHLNCTCQPLMVHATPVGQEALCRACGACSRLNCLLLWFCYDRIKDHLHSRIHRPPSAESTFGLATKRIILKWS